MPGKSGSAPAFSDTVVIPNQKGLHARASAQFVKCAECFDADITVTHDGQTVLGKSIMGLMMLAAGQGSTILVETRGPEAKSALSALISLVSDGFNEED
ncbi:MAG: HPr family phosphocarrier protein [Hyphomicrobiaceae bacterium]|nr:HPr family phosphocarrier protein [Hyphomicrobiaceae bacterium]